MDDHDDALDDDALEANGLEDSGLEANALEANGLEDDGLEDDGLEDDEAWYPPENLSDDELGLGRPVDPAAVAAAERQLRDRAQAWRHLPQEPVPEPPAVTPEGVGAVSRAIRWRIGANQRELADLAGVPPSSVIRMETEGESDVRLSTLVRIVGAAGLRLAVVDDEGTQLTIPFGQDRFHDHAYRLLPAHRPTYDPRTGYWWGKGLLQQPDPRHPLPARASRGRRRGVRK